MQNNIENMTINELMCYYLEKSEVANGGNTTAQAGQSRKIFVETKGGEGYSEQVEAKIWGEIKSEPTVLLKLFHEKYYALSHETYKEICNLLRRDLSKTEIIKVRTSQWSNPGDILSITLPKNTTIRATAWYEIPCGEVTLFQVDEKWYAISRHASKTTSVRTLYERRTGSFANPDPRREIIWYRFDLLGHGIADFPRKPKHLL